MRQMELWPPKPAVALPERYTSDPTIRRLHLDHKRRLFDDLPRHDALCECERRGLLTNTERDELSQMREHQRSCN